MKTQTRAHWLVKSEPAKYSWQEFVRDGATYWDGVRNYTARNNLRAMQRGDLVLFYHSNEERRVVGVARVTRASYPDPTTEDERWLVVDLKPVRALAEPVTLAAIKADAKFASVALVRQARLSVMPLSATAFARILKMGKTKLR